MSLSKLVIPSRQSDIENTIEGSRDSFHAKRHFRDEQGKKFSVAAYFFASQETEFRFFTGNGATSFF